jgi:hypothetical protein
MYNGVGNASIRGTGTRAVHRSVATVVKSSKEDYIKWKEAQERMEPQERVIDARILEHKARREKMKTSEKNS